MSIHSQLSGLELHEAFQYPQTNDPGAVGSGLYWLNPTTGILKRRASDNASWIVIGGSSSFVGLTDVPATYSAQTKKLVRVKSDETGLEFVDPSSVVVVPNQQTGTTYTLALTDNGKPVIIKNASSITVTLPNSFPVGFSCAIIQGAAGQITVAAESGGTVHNRQTQLKTAGQYAFTTVLVDTNSGTNAAWIFGGDTAA